MKQNERILVYLVTGFLAVILVVAVFFGRDGKAAMTPKSDDTVRGLGQILDQEPIADDGVVVGDFLQSALMLGLAAISVFFGAPLCLGDLLLELGARGQRGGVHACCMDLGL